MILEQDRKDAIVHAITDEYMRKILLLTISKAKPVEEISRETGIPISTCYRRVHEMFALRLLRIERTTITDEGKKFETFRSVVKEATLRFSASGELSVEVTLQDREPDERLTRMWDAIRKPKELPEIIFA